MAIEKLLGLATKIEKQLIRLADEPNSYDLLEDYPGEGSEPGLKLQAAQRAIMEDLSGIKDSYHAYENQVQQAQYGMRHQLYLLQAAKKVQQVIADVSKNGINSRQLSQQLAQIRKETMEIGKQSKVHVNLAELRSLRTLQGLVEDEAKRETPRPGDTPTSIDWAALSNRYRGGDTPESAKKSVTPPKSQMFGEPPEEQAPTPFPISETMQSATPKPSSAEEETKNYSKR